MASSVTVGSVEIEWLGHAAFMLKAGGRVIYIDPFRISGGEKADLILITHDHYDHCDQGSISSLKKPDTVIVGPESCSSKVAGIRQISAGQKLSFGDVDVRAVQAYNTNKSFHPRGSGIGFVVRIAGKTIYHAGDTDRIPEMDNLGKIDVALLPAGGTYTMNAEEAAQAANTIKPAMAIPMHWGKIVGSKSDAERFKELCKVEVRVLD